MIRRWSCLININNNFNNYNFFEKNYKINIFKSSVNFKRFTFKFTKFKRKSLIRLKHRSNWLIYTNIIKLWVKDYLFTKNYLKYQFLNKSFVNNFFFYNFNFIKNRTDVFFYNFNFLFCTFTNKNYLYFCKNKPLFIKNSPLFVSFLNNDPIINNSIIPVYSSYENMLFPYVNKNNQFDLQALFDVFFSINLNKLIEIRKILSIFFLFNLANFKNVKYFCY